MTTTTPRRGSELYTTAHPIRSSHLVMDTQQLRPLHTPSLNPPSWLPAHSLTPSLQRLLEHSHSLIFSSLFFILLSLSLSFSHFFNHSFLTSSRLALEVRRRTFLPSLKHLPFFLPSSQWPNLRPETPSFARDLPSCYGCTNPHRLRGVRRSDDQRRILPLGRHHL